MTHFAVSGEGKEILTLREGLEIGAVKEESSKGAFRWPGVVHCRGGVIWSVLNVQCGIGHSANGKRQYGDEMIDQGGWVGWEDGCHVSCLVGESLTIIAWSCWWILVHRLCDANLNVTRVLHPIVGGDAFVDGDTTQKRCIIVVGYVAARFLLSCSPQLIIVLICCCGATMLEIFAVVLAEFSLLPFLYLAIVVVWRRSIGRLNDSHLIRQIVLHHGHAPLDTATRYFRHYQLCIIPPQHRKQRSLQPNIQISKHPTIQTTIIPIPQCTNRPRT
mmetsp:Transcript_17656/g.31932  ORF Transcript_17656/g.31932 Transcript_17656/m.31932 type:complete len:274 (-) Transcript_17656:624-1445(-)